VDARPKAGHDERNSCLPRTDPLSRVCTTEGFPMPQFQPTMFPDIRGPFSGNVDQTINPWTWFFRGVTQFGLININL
jgi:hypothetical protein